MKPSSSFLRLLEIEDQRKKAPEVDSNSVPSNHETVAPRIPSTTHLQSTPPAIGSSTATLLPVNGDSNPSAVAAISATESATGRRKKVFTPPGKTQVNIRMPRHLKAKLDLLSAATGKSINDLVVDSIESRLQDAVAGTLSAFDLDDVLIEDPIIQLYARYTGRGFTDADRTAYEQVRHLNPMVVRVGVLATLIRKQGGQINSFAYFLPEIQNAAEQFKALAAPVDYVKYLDQKVRQKYKR